jgi:hypothetical protein
VEEMSAGVFFFCEILIVQVLFGSSSEVRSAGQLAPFYAVLMVAYWEFYALHHHLSSLFFEPATILALYRMSFLLSNSCHDMTHSRFYGSTQVVLVPILNAIQAHRISVCIKRYAHGTGSA